MAKATPRPLFPIPQSDAERILSSFTSGSPEVCWLWQKGCISTGYGECFVSGQVVLAHRASWVLHHGRDIPAGFVLRHECDNPRCVNPHHLIPGTQKQNVRDSIERGRHSPPPRFHGDQHPMAKLTNAQTLEIAFSKEDSLTLSRRYGVGENRINVIKRKYGNGVGVNQGRKRLKGPHTKAA